MTKDAKPSLFQYKRIYYQEKTARAQYLACALLINVCLLSQVIFASALTALGAGNGSHTQITALGAANTVIAAILTFTKGSGLPNRLRQYQQTLRKVREYIEQRERGFAQSDCKLNIDTELRTIRRMYEEARVADEKNDPSSYHSPAAVPNQDGLLPQEVNQDRPVPKVNTIASPVTPLPPLDWPLTPRPPARRPNEEHEVSKKSEDGHGEVDSMDSSP
ncbi:hypothetical protein N7G274_000133 [Stereocaulon virgatum]|uniref:SMODS and SLOG-associating 2TM effector domain-containing protein n=1 Tax=Stereocaulon virgatum TaxID=373712 RepID=A0ABR4AR90_9LECA